MRQVYVMAVTLAALASPAAQAQSVQAVVQVGPQVAPVIIAQRNSSGNFVGVIQLGGNPSTKISQTGASNFAGVGQYGGSTTVTTSQTGLQNLAVLGQFGASNTAMASQLGIMNFLRVTQGKP